MDDHFKKLGSNMSLLKHPEGEILISYNTPVAGRLVGIGYFKTDSVFSKTTGCHISKWLGQVDAQVRTQSWIKMLYAEWLSEIMKERC